MSDNIQLAVASVDSHVTDYLKVLSRRRWVAWATFLVVFTTTLIYSFVTTPLYLGQVQLLIEGRLVRSIPLGVQSVGGQGVVAARA